MRRMKQRLDEARRSALRRELADLGSGQADHETPELTARLLYPVTEHLRAFDPNVVLVVGPRGSGKTTLFKAFFSNDPDLVRAVAARMPKTPAPHAQPGASEWAWVAAHPAGGHFPDTQALPQCARSDEDARKIWHAMLVRCFADWFDGHWKEKLKPILDPMAAELGDVLSAYDAPETNPTAALDALERTLQQEGRGIFVGYDELDTLGGFDQALTARMVRGLVAFWSDYSRRWKRIRAKIFLRADLFRRHTGMGTADFAKLAATRTELRWSDAALLGMLVKRIANASDGLAAYCKGARIKFEDDDVLRRLPRVGMPDDAFPLLHRLAGEFMGAGKKKKGYVRNWILAHLRDGNGEISPRSLVRLVEQAAGKEAANQPLRPPRLIHPAALLQALDDVSHGHVTQSISSEWPWLEGVRTRLAADRLVPWERKGIVALLDADWDRSWGSSDQVVRPPVDRPADFLDYLIEIGVFRRRFDDLVDVTDLYLSGLRLRRKGGVKLGRSARRETPPALGRQGEE